MITSFNLSVRQLGSGDAHAFRAIRLKALRQEGEKFGPTFESEAGLSDEEWEKRVSPTEDTRIFGLFNGDVLIGVVRATKWDEDPSGKTALWGQAYVLPPYRGRRDENGVKLTALLYAARADFTFEQHPRYTSAVTFIRQDNTVSQNAISKYEKESMPPRLMDWPAREPVMWNFYRITSNYRGYSARLCGYAAAVTCCFDAALR